MGCDIHGWIEGKDKHPSLKYWKSCVNLNSIQDRNYTFFWAFFGVRYDLGFEPLFERRGFPKWDKFVGNDLTMKDIEQWEGDLHSASYFYVNEVDKFVRLEDYAKHFGLDRSSTFKKNPEAETAEYDKNEVMALNIFEGAHPIIRLMRYLRYYFEDVRCIVWFDN